MPPMIEDVNRSPIKSAFEIETSWIAAIVISMIVAATLLLIALSCGCGDKDKEDKAGAAAGAAAAAGGADEKKDGGKGEDKPVAYLDLSKPGVPPGADEKKRTAPEKKGIDPGNPNYQTLVNNSKFEASAAGLSPPPVKPTSAITTVGPMNAVSSSNPNYQTLVNTSKFEASQTGSKKAAK